MNDAGIHVRGLNSGHSEVTERGAVPQILCGPDPRNVSLPGERLSSLFERCAERYGAMPAVIDGGRMWTYIEIDAEANRLARLLALRGVKPGDRVALLLERSAETYIAILAVMKLGAAFVPLAAAFPEERMSLIIEDADVRFVVTMAEHVARAAALSVPHIVIAANCPETARQSDSPLNIVGSDDDICYILYTSGTTGRLQGRGGAPPKHLQFRSRCRRGIWLSAGRPCLSGHDDRLRLLHRGDLGAICRRCHDRPRARPHDAGRRGTRRLPSR